MISKQKIIDIYNNLSIPNWVSGNNVTRGWVNIQCPFCDDGSNHCGTNPSSELFSCWRCGKTGHFVDLLVTLTGLPFSQCKSMVSDSIVSFKEHPEEISEPDLAGTIKVALPKMFEFITNDTNFSLLDDYLERRNILRATLIEHECGICRVGKYMNRLVIPIYNKGELVSFQAADLTGFANVKYRSAPIEMGAINSFLYNYDKIKTGGRMIVEEGVLDAWRTGDEAVAAFTSALTGSQKKLILAKNLDELYFCFDCELTAYYKAAEIAKEFEAYIPTVEVVKLPFGKDPDELGREEIYKCILKTRV